MSAVKSRGERPAHHHVGVRVDDRGQVEPPLAGAQIRDVAHELVGGDGAVEVVPHQVGPAPGLGVGNGVRFPALGVRPRIPSSRTLYRVRPENLAGRKHFTDRARSQACGGGPGPFSDGIRVEAEFGAALRYRPARRDYVVGGLAPELVGVSGGWV